MRLPLEADRGDALIVGGLLVVSLVGGLLGSPFVAIAAAWLAIMYVFASVVVRA